MLGVICLFVLVWLFRDGRRGDGLYLPVLPGSFVYSMAADPAARGCLYRIVQPSEREAEDRSICCAGACDEWKAQNTRYRFSTSGFILLWLRDVKCVSSATSALHVCDCTACLCPIESLRMHTHAVRPTCDGRHPGDNVGETESRTSLRGDPACV